MTTAAYGVTLVTDILNRHNIAFTQPSPTSLTFWLRSTPSVEARRELKPHGYVLAASYDCVSKKEFPSYFWACAYNYE